MEHFEAIKQKWVDLEQPKKVKALNIMAIFSFFLFFVIVIVYSVGGVKKASVIRTSVVVFMEANPEDMMALRYTLKRSDLSVTAVVVSMNSWSQNAVNQYLAVLSLLSAVAQEGSSRALNVPVYYGSHVAQRNAAFDSLVNYSQPSQSVTSCSYMRVWPQSISLEAEVQYGVLFSLPQLASSASFLSNDAFPQYFAAPLASTLASVADKSVIALCLSTLTDFVTFWQQNPQLQNKWMEVMVSGGAMNLKGNTGDVQNVFPMNKAAEFNFFLDPRAANTLLRTISSSVSVVVVTRDAAVDASYTTAQFASLAQVSASGQFNTSGAMTSAILFRKRGLLQTTAVDLSAPQDLVAAAIMSETSVRIASTIGTAPLSVVKDESLSTDGTLRQSTAGVALPYVYGLDAVTFWQHIRNVELARYPKQ